MRKMLPKNVRPQMVCSRAAAKNDVTWEALYGSPSDKYKNKGYFYAKTLGVYK